MRKSAFFLSILAYSLFLPFVPKSHAADLTQGFIRLSRQSPSTTAGGLICTTTPLSDNGSETSVQIIFPTGFTVNQNQSNWQVSTDDIPSTATAWPGIGTAISISGQTVTFPSSDLSSSTQYCFNFSSNTLTNPSSTGNYPGYIRTRNGSTTIDSIEIGLFVIANDRIGVTATVPANPTDFSATLNLNNPSNNSFSQNTELSYTLQYASHLSNATGVTVEAEWELGKVSGSTTPTEDILDYVVGSASNAYNNTPPVIDIVNRKISWNINSLPAGSSQSVNFRLRTNSSYRNTLPVTFSVNGRVLGPGTQTADSTITSNYYNSNFVTPTPTPTCVPGACPTSPPSTVTPTPTLPPVSTIPTIYAVDVRTISSTNAAVFVAVNKNVGVRISYGTDPSNLSQTVSSNDPASQHLVEITSLKPKTRYYFRIVVIDSTGKTAGTDIYVFDTAISSTISKILTNSIIVTSGDVVLTNYLDFGDQLPNVIIPFDTQYSFRFAMTPYDQINSVQATLRSNSVLGATSSEPYSDTHSISITEIRPGQYIGRLLSDVSNGIYKLILQVKDYNGNLSEESVATVYIVNPLRVINKQTKEGIENAKVNLTYYNFRLRKYEPLSNSITAIKNPAFSDYLGRINIVLPEGKYKADITAFGYEERSVEFSIGPNESNYPIIELNKLPFSVSNYFSYISTAAFDAIGLINNYIDSIKTSGRYLELLTISVIILFIGLALFQISRIFGVSIVMIPFFALYHLIFLFHRPKHSNIIEGTVVGIVSNNPVGGVLIHFSNSSGKVFAHARTNPNGEFTVPVKNLIKTKITISKKGFETFSKTLSKEELSTKLTIAISKVEKPEKFGISTIGWYFESLAESLFETFLVLTIILEIIFAQQFGIWKVLPCLVVSIGNVLLWALHARPRSS